MSEEETFQVACICGSMRFKQTMVDVARELTKNGFIVLMPMVDVRHEEQGRIADMKVFLDRMHRAKIRMSDVVVVVDCIVPGGSTYIGESTQREIDYASMIRKQVGFYSSDYLPLAR